MCLSVVLFKPFEKRRCVYCTERNTTEVLTVYREIVYCMLYKQLYVPYTGRLTIVYGIEYRRNIVY